MTKRAHPSGRLTNAEQAAAEAVEAAELISFEAALTAWKERASRHGTTHIEQAVEAAQAALRDWRER